MTRQVGIDIVEIKRIKLKSNFIKKILSNEEMNLFNSFDNKKRQKEFVAGRWALKEALVKATKQQIIFNKINVGYVDNVPTITNPGFEDFHVSISHENKYAIAIVINESKDK